MAPVARCHPAHSYATWRHQIPPGLAKAALAGSVDGKLVDLTFPIEHDAAVRIVTDRSPEALPLYRHSTAHLLAAAVTNLFPGAQCGIGPATDDGFFYDFVVQRPIVPEDLDAIERKMKELAAQDLPYERQLWGRDRAKAFFEQRGEPLKVQLIDEKTAGQSEVSCYTIKDPETFVDFCVGPHVPSTGRLKAFKLLSTSNAYWKGDARNQPMQRVYGTAFLSEKDLNVHLAQVEEAKKRDHRKLGRELGLFTFHPWAPGAAFWLGKGTTLYQTLANYMREVLFPRRLCGGEDAADLQQGPLGALGSLEALPQGHVPHRVGRRDDEHEADELPGPFPHLRERGTQLPRPADPVSRADAAAPQRGIRRAFGSHARAPILAGRRALLRHQIRLVKRNERLIRLVQRVYGDFGLPYTAKLSTRPDEFLGEVATWDHAETQLQAALERSGLPYDLNEKDGAFYGPKIDFDVTDAIGRKWQCATIQLDYQQPENFDLKYIGADNAEHRPVVIHRAIFGSFERFMAILIEHYAGAFPLWLAPVQAIVLPIADRHLPYAASVRDRLGAAGLRVVVDERQEKIGYKIREAQLQKVPYMLVVGDREQQKYDRLGPGTC